MTDCHRGLLEVWAHGVDLMDDVLHSVDAVPEVKRDKVSRNPTSVPRLIPSSTKLIQDAFIPSWEDDAS